MSVKGGAYFWSDFLGGHENPVANFRGGMQIQMTILGGYLFFIRHVGQKLHPCSRKF